jgi:hypothetical protein
MRTSCAPLEISPQAFVDHKLRAHGVDILRVADASAVLLDATLRAVLDAFKVPPRDCCQIVHEHKANRVRFEDTGLNIARSDKFVLVQIATRPQPVEAKTDFYQKVCAELQRSCDIKPDDVMVSIATNTDADWSFGNGRAQFLTGELKGGATAPDAAAQPVAPASTSASGS